MTDSITPAPPADAPEPHTDVEVPDESAQEPVGERATRRKSSGWRSVVEWLVVIAGAVVLALVIKAFLFQVFYIPSESMLPTLEIGDRVIVNKLSYRLHDINRGDIVVFERPENDEANDGIEDLIKRVIALPNEKVVIKEGGVYVDGARLPETYLPEGTLTREGPVSCTDADPCVMGDDEIWVMGDNRNNSKDSRYFGAITEDHVVGRAAVRVLPIDRIGLL